MPDPVTAYLEEVRKAEQAATPGPWRAAPNTGAGRVWVQIGREINGADCEPLFNVRGLSDEAKAGYRQREADAAFIVSARTAVPRLRAAVEAVLALHERKGFTSEIRFCERHQTDLLSYRGCPDCETVETVHCWQRGCGDEWPCPTYRAISTALLGEVPDVRA